MRAKKIRQMRKEWDKIALINPHYGVDSIPEFECDEINEQRFWERGKEAAEGFLTHLQLGDTSSRVMVELGCGLGRMTHYFAKSFAKVHALDISSEMLERAKIQWKHLSNVEFILGSGSDLKPIKDSTNDFVFSFIVLQHVPDQKIVLNYILESGRVLRPGGIAFLQIPAYIPDPVSNSLMTRIKGLIPGPIKRPIKRVLGRGMPKPEVRRLPPTNLNEQFERDYAVWRGCKVSILDVEQVTRQCNLQIINIRGINTQYTYFTLKKCEKYEDRYFYDPYFFKK